MSSSTKSYRDVWGSGVIAAQMSGQLPAPSQGTQWVGPRASPDTVAARQISAPAGKGAPVV